MEENQTQNLILEYEGKSISRRRKLLPWWIKVFTWFFLILSIIAPLGLLLGLADYNFSISLYGFSTTEPLSVIGLGLLMLFMYKGLTAYGLWMEKDWAIILGQIDAVSGIIICIYSMVLYPFLDDQPGFIFNFRLELALLIPYFFKLASIKPAWENLKTVSSI